MREGDGDTAAAATRDKNKSDADTALDCTSSLDTLVVGADICLSSAAPDLIHPQYGIGSADARHPGQPV